MARWSRCDDIVVLDLYFKADRQQLQSSDPEVTRLSRLIGKTPASVQLKMANYQGIDPRRSGGLGQGSRQSREVWAEFAHDEQRLRRVAAVCKNSLRKHEGVTSHEDELPQSIPTQFPTMGNGNNRWSSCNNLLVLDLYIRNGRWHLSDDDEEVKNLSILIGKSARSVSMKTLNYQWIDPDRAGGLSRPSRESVRIWNEYAHNEQGLREAAANCKRQYRQ